MIKDLNYFLKKLLSDWQNYDKHHKGDDFYKSVNRISKTITEYEKLIGNDEYIQWHKDKLRPLLCCPSLNNGTWRIIR